MRRIWLPEVDAGYDPQGLAVAKTAGIAHPIERADERGREQRVRVGDLENAVAAEGEAPGMAVRGRHVDMPGRAPRLTAWSRGSAGSLRRRRMGSGWHL